MRNQLTKEQTIKAHHYILKTTQIIVSETLLQIKNIPQEELDLFGEINLLIEEMKEGYGANGQEKPYQMIKNGKEFYDISEREYELLSI
ncbi:hypothetical protein JCM9140_4459 [Halalkalibacter wakoensis JCM 9140]|uniref:Uncharacterized protein n=1 Tax=Halalkalibacter wakoensis JCM 9140 TaxID=1236970 RepID=W4Q847_9BACI|nr:hypothetical protein [Halalkalibacter wakoensis]GAE28246.1 hypothetical protein JCM9140_4459 [Halalkalibacter wakoensis JCM 9140]